MLPTVDGAGDCCNQLSLQADMRSRRVRRQMLVVAIVVLACFTYLTAAMEGNLSSLRKLQNTHEAHAPDARPFVLKTPPGIPCDSRQPGDSERNLASRYVTEIETSQPGLLNDRFPTWWPILLRLMDVTTTRRSGRVSS